MTRSGIFRKQRAGAPADYYAIEAAGLSWLTVAGGPPIPQVVEVGDSWLQLRRLPSAQPTRDAAADFGRRLAVMHRAGAHAYGSPPASVTASTGFIADLVLPYGQWPTFGPFYASTRVGVYLDTVAQRGELDPATGAVFGRLLDALHRDDPRLVGPPEPPSRLHGDLWSGNVLFSAGPSDHDGTTTSSAQAVQGWLIDPAAHGGHRETDLAMLALFGMSHLYDIITGYQQVAPLATGWQQRVALHQVHPLLVHAVLFGGGYLDQARAAARRALTAAGL